MECYFLVRDVPPRLDTDRTKGGGGRGGWGNGRVSSSHIKKSMETGESSFNIFYLTQLYLKYHFNIQSVYIVLIKYITISSPQHLSSD